MKLRTLHPLRTLGTAAAVTGALAAVSFSTTSALAVPAPNGASNVLALAGSDTIQDVDTAISAKYNASAANPAPRDSARNIPAVPTTPFTVAGDAFCETRTYSATPAAGEFQAPNGSTAGKAALALSAGNGDGCIDIARSSSPRSSTDPATFEYYAFARDAVSYATFSGGPAPANLTINQLRGIYNCTFTNYNQVGGAAGPIQRYLPQDGSGTRKFFIANVLLGADPTTISSPDCPVVKTFQENTGTTIPAQDRAAAIAPYSAGQYIAQANKVIPDVRDGAVIGKIDGKTPIAVNPNTGALKPNTAVYRSTTFPGSRDVFHVVDVRSPSYNDALRFVGFDAAGPGALCNGAFNGLITKYGFVPNVKLTGAQGICRQS